MSVPNQIPYIIYNANGLTTVFPFEFYIINSGDIQVTINGTVITSGYTVSGAGNVGGGDVIFLTPPANGSVVMLERVVPTYRLTDYQDNGDLLADTVNKDFDRIWMAIQRSSIYLGLALRRPLFGGPFNAEGYRIEKLATPVSNQDGANKKYVDDIYVYLLQTINTALDTIKNGLYGYNTKKSFEMGNTLNYPNDALYFESEGEYYRWDGALPKVVPPGSTPESAGGIGKGKWVGVGDASLRSDLNSNSGADLVRTSSGNTVQQELDKRSQPAEVNVKDFASLKDAIGALPADGGVVNVPIGRFYSGSWNPITDYMGKPNVHIRGVKMPVWNDDASSLVGGSVIEGRLSVCAHNLTVSDIGFDLGKVVCDTRYPGADTTTDHPDGGTWDAFSFEQPSQVSPVSARRNLIMNNVVGLLKDSATVGHAILIENVIGGFVDNVIGIYGVHGLVVKSSDMRIGAISGYMASVDNVIFKSDFYAGGGGLLIDSVEAYRYAPNCNPHSTPAVASYGVYFNPETFNFTAPIQIGRISVRGAQYAVIGANASENVGPDIQIGEINVDGSGNTTEWAFFFANFGTFPRMSVGSLNITNVKNGVYAKYKDSSSNGNIQLTIGSLKITNCDSIAILAAGYQRLIVNTFEAFGAQTAYYVDNTARLDIGKENLVGVTTVWGTSPYIVDPNWASYGSNNSTLDVFYSGFRVNLKGLIIAGAAPSGSILTLPEYLRPKESLRFIAYANTSSRPYCLIGVSASGIVSIDEGSAPPTGTLVSLDGISWEAKQ